MASNRGAVHDVQSDGEVETANKEREELQDKRKKFRSSRFTTYQEWRENRRSFWSEMRIHVYKEFEIISILKILLEFYALYFRSKK